MRLAWLTIVTMLACSGGGAASSTPAADQGGAGGGSGGRGGAGPGPDGGAGRAQDGGGVEVGGREAGAAGGPSVCPGTEPLDPGMKTCRRQEDCGFQSNCGPEYVRPTGCGACHPAMRACEKDADCGPNGLCEELPYDGCTCAPGRNSRCGMRCSATSCGPASRCNATGHCEPISCTEGFACAPTEICDRKRAGTPNGCAPRSCATDGWACPAGMECTGGDVHGCGPPRCDHGGASCPPNYVCEATAGGNGCRVKTCAQDGDCDCGACIEGTCQPRIYVCSPLGVP